MASLTSTKFLSLIILNSILITGCGSGGSAPNDNVAVESDKQSKRSSTAVFSSAIESSPLCPRGGIEIHTGIDTNQNGLLDENEINNSQELCHADTSLILTSVDALELESECFFGGNRLRIGYDENENGTLENSEVIQSNLFCAQQQAFSLALLAFNNEPIEPGEECAAGGRKLSSGIDQNGNQVLDLDEVSDVEYLCDYDGPIRPYQYNDDCEYTSCDLIELGSPRVFVPEVNESAYITQVFDDGFGQVTLTADASLPSWLRLELSEFKTGYYYYSDGFYDIVAVATDIPAEAYGQTFASKVNVTDGQSAFDIEFSVKVIEPIRISLDESELEIIEPGNDENLVQFINVTFDKPLPKTLYTESSSSYNGISHYMLDVYFEENGEELGRSNSNVDFSVEWIGDSLFRGQTEGTIMLTIHDDHLPETTENYKIVVGSNSFSESKGVSFKPAQFSLRLVDDGDSVIAATLALDSESVNEASTAEDAEELGFTIRFDQPLPSDASIQLRLEPTDNAYFLGGEDLGFNDSCSANSYGSYYCYEYTTVSLYRGMTEYDGTVKIKPDALKEGNEEFSLSVKQNSISFIMADLEATFTIIDDDEAPAINFVDDKIESYYKESVINVPLKLSNPSIDDVELTFSSDVEGSLIEGTHFDFAVSMPMVFSGRADELYLPIIVYETEFEAGFLSTKIHVDAVSGVSNGTSISLELVLDKISPLYLSASTLNVPVTEGANVYGNYLSVSEDRYIYKVGQIRDGNIVGQEAIGDRDLFAAKFDTQGNLIWGRQFGTASWDNLSSSSVSAVKNDNGILVQSNVDFYLNEFGVITPLTDLVAGYALNVSDLQKDDEGNFFLLATKSYYSADGDLDGDGSTTDFIVAKYDSEWNQLWITEDFTDIEPAHSDFDFNTRYMRVTKSGIPYILGSVRYYDIDRSFNSLTSLGGDDLMLASFNKADGSTRSLQNFGSDLSDSAYYAHLQPKGQDQLLGFYRVSSGTVINGEIADSTMSARFDVDALGNVSQALYKSEGVSRRVDSLEVATNGNFFVLDTPPSLSNVRNYSILDEGFNLVSSVTETGYSSSHLGGYFGRTPVYLEEGAYLVTSNGHVTKLTSAIKTRLPD